VLYGTSAVVICQLQMALNAATRLVVGLGKYQHITPVLRDVLHWLPVHHRIQFKIAALTFDCVRGIGPAYFNNIACTVADNILTILASARLGSFFIAAPVVWNSLPLHLRSPSISRSQPLAGLKTHPFQAGFSLTFL